MQGLDKLTRQFYINVADDIIQNGFSSLYYLEASEKTVRAFFNNAVTVWEEKELENKGLVKNEQRFDGWIQSGSPINDNLIIRQKGACLAHMNLYPTLTIESNYKKGTAFLFKSIDKRCHTPIYKNNSLTEGVFMIRKIPQPNLSKPNK